MPTAFDRAILETLAFYDIFEYPLTLLELWRKLPAAGAGFSDAFMLGEHVRGSAFLQERVETDGVFYFLRGRGIIVSARLRRYRESLRKVRKAMRAARWIASVPFVRGVALCNSLGFANADRDSDIDFFILARRGRLWITRALAIFFAECFASRPSEEKSRDGICLSFFAQEDKNVLHLRLPGGDPYFTWWMTGLAPLYEADDAFHRWWTGNRWMASERPHTGVPAMAPRLRARPFRTVLAAFRLIPSWLWAGLEWSARRIERWHLPQAIKERANRSTDVVINDEVLKFHTTDRRAAYRLRWEDHVRRLCGI